MQVTHIVITGNNLIPVITPLISTPDKTADVIVLSTNGHKKQQEMFVSVAKNRGLSVIEIALCEEISETLEKLTERVTKGNNMPVVNTTNLPTKFVIQLYEWLKTLGGKMYSVDVAQDQIDWIYPEISTEPISEKLNIRHYLSLFGIHTNDLAANKGVPKSVRELGAYWVANIDDLTNAFSKLNYIATRCRASGSYTLEPHESADNDLKTLLDDLETIGYLKLNNTQVTFTNEAARQFANGGWLEEYTHGVIIGLKSAIPTCKEVAKSVEIVRSQGQQTLKNELDVVCLVNNKLHIIECKTKNMSASESKETLYKLDSLTDILGGVQARAMLISCKPLTKNESARAQELDIEVVQPGQLQNLSHYLKLWLASA